MGKILCWGFLAKCSEKWAQSEVFQVYWKVVAQNIFEFLHKVTSAQELEIDVSEFFGKNLELTFLEWKEPQVGSKWGFSSFIKK